MIRPVATALLVLGVSVSAAVAQDAPDPSHGLPPETCPVPPDPAFDWMAPPKTHDALAAARREIADYYAATGLFAECVFEARDILRAEWKAANRAPDPVVERAIDNAADALNRYGRVYEVSYNDAAEAVNAKGTGPRLPMFDLDAMPPPVSHARPQGRLTLQAFLDVSQMQSCNFNQPVPPGTDIKVLYDVAADGTAGNVRIVRSNGAKPLDAAYTACVAQDRVLPAIRDGVPAASTGYSQRLHKGPDEDDN